MSIHGFELVAERDVAEIKSKALLYRHAKTGAQLLSLVNDDENKVFGITFRTPPKNSTGVAHILEHSVLCGSRKYPVKEPFVELLKSSLKTFLNAFTFPDKTCYPVASQNTQDFYNLIDVYLDAVFFPRLTPEVLMQEGWHLETESEASPLTYQGVVYGEMKGVYSSPDSVLGEASQQSLFPDNTYGLDSGGNPKEIPNLTFEAFKAFHDEFYHPSNARIFFWGDDDPTERLRIVDEYLSQFQARKVDSTVALQPRLAEPRTIVKPYAASEPGESDNAMVTVNWLLPEVTNAEATLAFQILEHVLIGTPASPLHKALIDSGLGEDLAGAGLETDLRQMYFSTGLKGIERDRAEDVERLVVSVLGSLAEDGIPRDLLDASINSIEFRLREANTGSYPKGLIYMLQALRSWLYDADPLGPLAFEGPLGAVKSKAQAGGYFEGLLREHFLDNPHRSRVLLIPDQEEGPRRDKQEQEHLAQLREKLSSDDVRKVIDQAQLLKQKQQAPDRAEDLATIPTLSVADLPRLGKRIPEQKLQLTDGRAALHFHDINTFGIAYLDVAFDLSVVPQQDIPLLPLFGRALLETGTDKQDFVSLSRRISATTGGIWPDLFASTEQQGATSAWFMLRGKAMLDKGQELTSILHDVLHGARLEDQDRIRQLLLEEKAQAEMGIIPSGHSMVDARIRASFSDAAWVNEQTGGISYLFFLRELLSRFDQEWPSVLERLQGLRRRLFDRSNTAVNVTLDEAGFQQFKPHVDRLVASLPSERPDKAAWKRAEALGPEGLTMPAQVHYVGKGGSLRDLGYTFHGSALVITRFLRTSWLWDRIRVQGGAYGAFCRLDRLTGVFTFLSYRDPNLERTLQAFDETAKFLAEVSLPQEELDKNILGAIGDLDSYLLPDAKGHVAFLRSLTGQTQDILDRIRAEVFETNEQHFRDFGRFLSQLNDKGTVAVLGGEESIRKAAGPLGLRLVSVL
jgi:Zn-dependent M16 (insulinase) family peptidase